MPASPSTSIICPFLIVAVAAPVPTTAGMRYSRATTALWLRLPPGAGTPAPARARRPPPRRGREAVPAGHHGAVAEDAAGVRHDRHGGGEQRRPRWGGRL